MTIELQFIVGTVLGSFLSLVSLRIFRHESIIRPASHCDHCQHQLQPWEMIPVVSFLILRGKCSHCRQPIGWVTFIGEVAGGVITTSNSLNLTGSLETGFELLLLFAALCDCRTRSVPDWTLLSLLTLALIQRIFIGDLNPVIFLIVISTYLVITALNHHCRFIGNGDVDLMFILLIKTNLNSLIFITLISSGMAILKYVITHQSRLIPYFPYLSLAYFLLFHL